MKTMSSFLIAMGLFVIAVQLADAQEPHKGMPFEAIDVDGDGSLTREELSQFTSQMFAGMDLDENGTLSQDEVTRAAQARAAERSKKRFALADEDGNGVIDETEFSDRRNQRHAALFTRFDANEDGVLSRQETEKAWHKRKHRN